MKTIEPGKKYELSNGESITFLSKGVNGEKMDGTTNEEVLSVLVDRISALQKRQYCHENSMAIQHLEIVTFYLEKRVTLKSRRSERSMMSISESGPLVPSVESAYQS